MPATAIPRPVERLLGLTGLEWLARLALASPFLVSGVVKLFDFAGAAEEVAGLGLRPGGPFAAAVILTQLGGSALFMTRRFCWLGAGILVGFTVLATLLAHPFWTFEAPDRGRQTATFFEHLAIVGGFAVAAMLVNGRTGSA
jgi:uncharacterized membrane protein YphA (DoxX/SURF4 family)